MKKFERVCNILFCCATQLIAVACIVLCCVFRDSLHLTISLAVIASVALICATVLLVHCIKLQEKIVANEANNRDVKKLYEDTNNLLNGEE